MSDYPANEHAERTILGAALLDNECLKQASTSLYLNDWSLESHRIIWHAMCCLSKWDIAVDTVTLAEELDGNKLLISVGGRPYLFSLTEGLPRRPAIKDYVKIVKGKSLQRQLIQACEAAVASAYDGKSGMEIIAELRAKCDEIEAQAKGKRA